VADSATGKHRSRTRNWTEAMRLSGTDLTCRRGGREIFAGLNFAVSAGEALMVSGRNGAGKSSLLRMLAGLLHVTHGKLDLADGDPDLAIGEQAHYLGHQDALKPSLSVAENLEFWVGFLGPAIASRGDALAAVGLDTIADLPAGYLSAGQRRRLSLARLLAVKRPIWLLDEPASTLDAAGQRRLRDFMRAHLVAGGLIVAATHASLGIDGAQELLLDQLSPTFAQATGSFGDGEALGPV
jgi:heme exporter protein A